MCAQEQGARLCWRRMTCPATPHVCFTVFPCRHGGRRMDTHHIAELVRHLGATPSRRAVSTALLGLAAHTALAPLVDRASARGKGKKKKQKGKCESNWACPLDEICKGGRCTTGCDLSEGRGPEGQTCSPATKRCTTNCQGFNGGEPANELCPYGQLCHDGASAWCGSPCGAGGVPCPAGFLCYEGE